MVCVAPIVLHFVCAKRIVTHMAWPHVAPPRIAVLPIPDLLCSCATVADSANLKLQIAQSDNKLAVQGGLQMVPAYSTGRQYYEKPKQFQRAVTLKSANRSFGRMSD